MTNVINVSKFLTSAEFYDTLLRQVYYMKQFHRNSNPVILDFSETKKIEPLVISNMLCLGEYIRRETGTRLVIRIPETTQAGKLKFYMNEIGFTRYANDKIYEFESSPYNGIEGTPIDPLCKCLHFKKEFTRDEIKSGINGYVVPFTNSYLKQFEEFSDSEDSYVNKIDHFLYEIVDNCCKHGESDSFVTIHARYSDRRIYIAASDSGIGFLTSWNSRQKDEDDKTTEKCHLNSNPPKTEYDAILCGVYKRKKSEIYGLYNIIKQTLDLNGIIRIHSNDTQVVFAKDQGSARDFIFPKRNLQFKGTHIEMEIPF